MIDSENHIKYSFDFTSNTEQQFCNRVLTDILTTAEKSKNFVQGPDYWVKITGGLRANIKSYISENRIHLICFGVDDNASDHHFVGELSSRIGYDDDDMLIVNGFIEVIKQGFKYGLALETVRQDLLQRMSNELKINISQKVVDANRGRLDFNSGMRAAWLKIYGQDGYFDFDENGEKMFIPNNKSSGFKNVGRVELSLSKDENGKMITSVESEVDVTNNPRSKGEELKTELRMLLDPYNTLETKDYDADPF